LRRRYEKCEAFKQLLAQHDRRGKFRNEFLAATLYS
jgi:hypothetical protein